MLKVSSRLVVSTWWVFHPSNTNLQELKTWPPVFYQLCDCWKIFLASFIVTPGHPVAVGVTWSHSCNIVFCVCFRQMFELVSAKLGSLSVTMKDKPPLSEYVTQFIIAEVVPFCCSRAVKNWAESESKELILVLYIIQNTSVSFAHSYSAYPWTRYFHYNRTIKTTVTVHFVAYTTNSFFFFSIQWHGKL